MRIDFNMEVGAMRSKTVSLLAVAFSLGFAQAASAADMPTKAPIVSAPSVLLTIGRASMSAATPVGLAR
jgi:hypothetical protein